MENQSVRKIVFCGLLAAIYTVVSLALAPISYGAVQVRVSEALCVLPFLWPFGIWGLFVGCLVTNLVGMAMGVTVALDVIIGPLVTLAAAYLTSKAKNKWLCPAPAVILNAVAIGAMIAWVSSPEAFLPAFVFNMATVGLGQLLACYGLGMPLLFAVQRVTNKKGLLI